MDEDKNKIDFLNLLIRIAPANLTGREMKYLIWRFYNNKNARQIAWLDGKRIKKSAVSEVMGSAFRKIKLNFKKTDCIL